MGFIFDRLPGNSGVLPREITVDLVAHAAITKGVIYTIDMTFTPSSTYGVAVASAAVAAGAEEGTQWVMAMEAIDSGSTGKFLIQGYTEILVQAAADLSAGDKITSDGAGAAVVAAANDMIIGLAPEANTGLVLKAWFCGTGLGTKGA